MSTYTDYVNRLKQQNSDVFLGSLVWYTVSETTVLHSRLVDALTAVDLQHLAPPKPRNEDVFRRIAPNGHRKKVSTTNDAMHVNYLIRQVRRGGGSCIKHIVAEYVDGEGVTLEYEDVFEMHYDGTKDELFVRPLGAGDATAGEIAKEIAGEFGTTRGRVDATAIRTIIRKGLDEAHAANVRPTGGVYFVMKQHSKVVDALEGFASAIPGALVHSVPLVDDGRQREMLRSAYEAETVGEVERALGEVAALLKPDAKVTAALYGRLSAQFSDLMSKNREYMALLEDTLEGADSKLSIFRQQMTALLKKVE